MGQMTGKKAQDAAKEAWRTVPPREHGGNCDIKNLSRGSRIYFPVYVKGGGLSMGDIHRSQGDGEITFCGAIEMAGWIDIGVDLIKDGIKKYGITNPIFKTEPNRTAVLGIPGFRGHLGRRDDGQAALS
jgi:formamidase